MIKAEKFLKDFTKADSAVISATNEENSSGVTEKISAVPAVSISSADDWEFVMRALEAYLTVYRADSGEIEKWHSCVNRNVENFLKEYDLGSGTKAFKAFKIGFDAEKHAITFALNNDVEHLRIYLVDTDVKPIDEKQAEKVLNFVNSIRIGRLKCCRNWI